MEKWRKFFEKQYLVKKYNHKISLRITCCWCFTDPFITLGVIFCMCENVRMRLRLRNEKWKCENVHLIAIIYSSWNFLWASYINSINQCICTYLMSFHWSVDWFYVITFLLILSDKSSYQSPWVSNRAIVLKYPHKDHPPDGWSDNTIRWSLQWYDLTDQGSNESNKSKNQWDCWSDKKMNTVDPIVLSI